MPFPREQQSMLVLETGRRAIYSKVKCSKSLLDLQFILSFPFQIEPSLPLYTLLAISLCSTHHPSTNTSPPKSHAPYTPSSSPQSSHSPTPAPSPPYDPLPAPSPPSYPPHSHTWCESQRAGSRARSGECCPDPGARSSVSSRETNRNWRSWRGIEWGFEMPVVVVVVRF